MATMAMTATVLAAASITLAALTGCDSGSTPATTPEVTRGVVVDAASRDWMDLGGDPVVAASDAPAAARYWQAYLAETVAGDPASARTGYEAALARGATVEPLVAARAALRLATLEGVAGNRMRALELVARATSLAPDDAAVMEQADRLQARLAAAPVGAGEVRGPPAGTPLGGDPVVAARFAAAEAGLVGASRLRLRPVLEALAASVRAKEGATEAAARAYREVAAAGGLAEVAAELRIASLYHDLALALVFDLPPELDPRVASKVRKDLHASAASYLRKAIAAYRRSLNAAAATPPGTAGAEADPWRVAAEANLRAAADLLGETP